MDDHAQQRNLDKIEQRISELRFRYLHAVWAGHDGEAQFIEEEIDAGLDEWDRTRSGRKAAT